MKRKFDINFEWVLATCMYYKKAVDKDGHGLLVCNHRGERHACNKDDCPTRKAIIDNIIEVEE